MDYTDQTLGRLAQEATKVGCVTGLPSTQDGRLDCTGPVGEFLVAAESAAAAGYPEEAQDLLLDSPAGEGEVSKALRLFALMRLNDREFAGHNTDGLLLERLDFVSLPTPSHRLEVGLETTTDGGLRPISSRSDERVFANVSCEIQILGTNDDDSHAARVHERGFDDDGLEASEAVRFRYHQRLSRRLLWGFAQCVFTDQRLFGVVFQRDDDRSQRSEERVAMPDAEIFPAEGRPVGSVVMFSMERQLFDERVVQTPLLSRRLPIVVLSGDAVDVVIYTMGAEDAEGQVGRPAKGHIATAVDQFWATS